MKTAMEIIERIQNILVECREGGLDEAVRLIVTEIEVAKYEAYEDGRNDAIAEFKSVREQAWSEAVEMGRKEGRREGLLEGAKVCNDAMIPMEAGLHGHYDSGYNDACVHLYDELRAKAAEKGE